MKDQLLLVYTSPTEFTDEPIIDQLSQFAELGFNKSLKDLLNSQKVPTNPGIDDLALLNDIIATLENLPNDSIHTQTARVKYSILDHLARIQKTKDKHEKLHSENNSSKPGTTEETNLVKNVTIRAAEFKLKIIALRDPLVLNHAQSRYDITKATYESAKNQLIFIQKLAEQARSQTGSSEQELTSIDDGIAQIATSLTHLDTLVLQATMNTCCDPVIKQQVGYLINEMGTLRQGVDEFLKQAQEAKQAVCAFIQEKAQRLLEESRLPLVQQEKKDSSSNDVSAEPAQSNSGPLDEATTASPESPSELGDQKDDTPASQASDDSSQNNEETQEPFPALPQSNSNPLDEAKQLQQQAKQARFDVLIDLVNRYQLALQNETGALSFFHRARHDAKLSYCGQLLQTLQENPIDADSDIKALVQHAHQAIIDTGINQSDLLSGGSYFGTSRMLALHRLLGIEDAWSKGKSSCLGFKTNSDFHGLKTIGLVDEAKSIVTDFFKPDAAASSAFERLCTQVAPRR